MISYIDIQKLNKILADIEKLEQRILYLFRSRLFFISYLGARAEVLMNNQWIIKLM